MSYDFNTLFAGEDEDRTPIRDTYFLKILRLNEDKHRHLMRLVLHAELKREALCIAGEDFESVPAAGGWKIPDDDYEGEKYENVEFFRADGVSVTSLFVAPEGIKEKIRSRRWRPGWTLHDSDYLEYLSDGFFETTYVLALDPTRSRDKQVKAMKDWLDKWLRAYPSRRRAGPPRSVKARLVDLACWRLWRWSRWRIADERALAEKVGRKINDFLPDDEAIPRLRTKQEIGRRCRRAWLLVSARIQKS